MLASPLLLCVSQFPKFSTAVWSSVPSLALLHNFPRFFILCFILNMLCRWQQYRIGKRQLKSSLEKLKKSLQHTTLLASSAKEEEDVSYCWWDMIKIYYKFWDTNTAGKADEIYIKLGWQRKRSLSCSNTTDIQYVLLYGDSQFRISEYFPADLKSLWEACADLYGRYFYLVFSCTWLNSFWFPHHIWGQHCLIRSSFCNKLSGEQLQVFVAGMENSH